MYPTLPWEGNKLLKMTAKKCTKALWALGLLYPDMEYGERNFTFHTTLMLCCLTVIERFTSRWARRSCSSHFLQEELWSVQRISPSCPCTFLFTLYWKRSSFFFSSLIFGMISVMQWASVKIFIRSIGPACHLLKELNFWMLFYRKPWHCQQYAYYVIDSLGIQSALCWLLIIGQVWVCLIASLLVLWYLLYSMLKHRWPAL